MNKQTAVNWLVEQLDIVSKHDIDGQERFTVIQMANEMFKEQIREAYVSGFADAYFVNVNTEGEIVFKETADEYYRETFDEPYIE